MVTIVFPGPRALASRIAPATFTPLEPPSSRALFLEQVEADRQHFLIRNTECIVDFGTVQVTGHPSLADSLGNRVSFRGQFAGLDPAVDCRPHGIGGRRDDVRVFPLQEFADARQRPSGADCADKTIHGAVGLLPNLRSRAHGVPFAVGDVVPLVGIEHAVGLGGCQFSGGSLGDVNVIVGVAIRYRGYLSKYRAAQSQRILLFLSLRVRHQDQRAVSAGISHQGQADAGIPGRALHDQSTRLQRSAALRVKHHVLGRPILDGPAGIEKLGLAENRTACQFRGLAKFDQGRIAHRIHESVANTHVCFPQGLPVIIAGESG